MMTSSQSAANRKRGREQRRRDETLRQLNRAYDRHEAGCLHGDEQACEKARLDYGEIQDLPPVPQR